MATSYESRLGTAPEEGVKAPCWASTSTNITLSGEQTHGGIPLVAGNRVLVRSQTNTTENGIYICNVGAWIRAPDFNEKSDVIAGMLINDRAGDVSANAVVWQLNITGDYVPGTTPVTFSAAIVYPGYPGDALLDSDAKTPVTSSNKVITEADITNSLIDSDAKTSVTPSNKLITETDLNTAVSTITVTDITNYGAKVDGITDDIIAVNNALSSGASYVTAPAGIIKVTDTITIPEGVSFIGKGIAYWELAFQNAENVKKINTGTHILFAGTGPKTQIIRNLNGAQTAGGSKTSGTLTPLLTDFTDAGGHHAVGADPQPFSCGVILNNHSQLKNMRIVPKHGATNIEEYNNVSSTALSDDWDVGLWCKGAHDAVIDNVQVVGHWRKGGTLITENDGTWNNYGNSERLYINNLLTQGLRGLIIRNTEQTPVTSNTSTTVNVQGHASQLIPTTGEFRLQGTGGIDSSVHYTYTSVTTSGADIKFNGVSPSIVGTAGVMRNAYMGAGFAGTRIENTLAVGLEHISDVASQNLGFGLGISGPLEMSGYPLRGIRFDNFKAQAINESLSAFFGDCRDIRFTDSQFEGGELFALSNTEESYGYTSNLRMLGTKLGESSRVGFTPRDAMLDTEQFPTEFSSGEFVMKPWRAVNLQIKNYNDEQILKYTESNDSAEIKSTGFGVSNRTGTKLLDIFSSGTSSFYGSIHPKANNTQNLGTSSLSWNNIYYNKLITSDLTVYADDAAAATGGVAIGDLYIRTGGWISVRLA